MGKPATRTRELATASGRLDDVIQKLARAVYARGGYDEDIVRAIITDKNRRKEVVDVIMKDASSLITVDTTLGLKGLLAAVGAVWVNPDILNPRWNPPVVVNRGVYEATVELLPLGKNRTTAEAQAFVDEQGFRPALPEETLASCAKNKDAQREVQIVCLQIVCLSEGGFWVDPGGDRSALVLRVDAGGRGASTCTGTNRSALGAGTIGSPSFASSP